MDSDLFTQSRPEPTAAASSPGSSPDSMEPPRRTLPRWLQSPPLALLFMLVCASLLWFALAQWLVSVPHLPLRLLSNVQHELVLQSSNLPALQQHIGQRVTMIGSERDGLAISDDLISKHSPRWLTSDKRRSSLLDQHRQLTEVAKQGLVTLQFADGSAAQVSAARFSLDELPADFWLRATLATALALTALSWLLAAAPRIHRCLALLTFCQAVLVTLDALGSGLGTPVPPLYLSIDRVLRDAAELTMVGALLQASTAHIANLTWVRRLRLLTWLVIALLVLLLGVRMLPQAWWWMQLGVQLAITVAWLTQLRSQRLQPHPWTALLTQFTFPAMLIWPLVTLTEAAGIDVTSNAPSLSDLAPQLWSFALSALFLVLPFMMNSQRVAREIVLWSALALGSMAGVLLWTALRAPTPLSVVWLNLLAVVLAGVVARWWLSHHMFERRSLRATQLFEGLYRAIRSVDTQPQQAQAALTALLGSIFAPLRVEPLERQLSSSVILADGASLLIPVPNLHPSSSGPPPNNSSLLLHGSQEGRRLFTQDDARLADLVVEQIHRAVLFEKAVELGRNEERSRLAQDLHDDIGARLLTLMYKSTTPEMEDYLRHTLKDLKTLTRGLSATNHSLSFACAEWKTDMAQRLAAADCELQWSATWEQDLELSIVQWSAVTRILRELVSNAIAHAHATTVRIELYSELDQLMLRVQDNGKGNSKPPELWAHGLGLSGVRKRVKQLGGSVAWTSLREAGVLCEIKLSFGKPGAMR